MTNDQQAKMNYNQKNYRLKLNSKNCILMSFLSGKYTYRIIHNVKCLTNCEGICTIWYVDSQNVQSSP